MLGPLAETKVENNPAWRADPTQPVADEDLDRLPINPQTKRFDKSAFVYDEATDQYFCPAGKPLPHRTTEHTTHGDGKPVVRSTYTCHDCVGCPLAARCRAKPDSPRGREISHDEHEGARRRQHFGERPFAVIKACFAFRRFLLRGIDGVRQEWLWVSTAFILKRLMTLMAALRAEVSKIAV